MTIALTHTQTRIRVKTRIRDVRGDRVRRMRLALYVDKEIGMRAGFIVRVYRQTCEVMLLGTHPHNVSPFARVSAACLVQIM